MIGNALRLWQGSVIPEWLDYNGHMTEHRYLQIFSDTSDALYVKIGLDLSRAAEGSYYTLETHLRHLAETHSGESLRTETEILGYDDKRLHLFHRLYDAAGKLLATAEHLVLHVAGSRGCPASAHVLAEVISIFESQRQLPLSERLGGVLRQPLANSRLDAADKERAA